VQVNNLRLPHPPPITPAQVAAAEAARKKEKRADIRLASTETTQIRSSGQGQGQGQSQSQGYVEQRQFLQGAPVIRASEKIIRKYISSLGANKVGSTSSFTFTLSESLKRVIKVRFISINIIYVVPANQPTMGLVHLNDFPKETPYYLESGEGKKYSATLRTLPSARLKAYLSSRNPVLPRRNSPKSQNR